MKLFNWFNDSQQVEHTTARDQVLAIFNSLRDQLFVPVVGTESHIVGYDVLTGDFVFDMTLDASTIGPRKTLCIKSNVYEVTIVFVVGPFEITIADPLETGLVMQPNRVSCMVDWLSDESCEHLIEFLADKFMITPSLDRIKFGPKKTEFEKTLASLVKPVFEY